jgi:energy-converting hydrogenase Eha subunit A
MAANSSLVQFVHDALSVGRSREDIRIALTDAGWSQPEIADSLSAFAATDFTPPVPRPHPHLTARDTFIYLILFSTLGFVGFNLISLVHGILDLALPDSTAREWEVDYAADSIRWSIAALVVSTPVYVWLTLGVQRRIRNDSGHRRSPARKWLTYMALFAAALVFLGDITYVIYSFLTGETTLRFLAKAAVVAGVSGAIFWFYLRDIEEKADER